MKRIKHFTLALLCLAAFSISASTLLGYEALSDIDIPEEGDIMHCRCKHDGCYAGNWISFRAECATGHGTVNCSESANNCAPR
ncbi:MAG: hypothetical protein RR555_06500 [Bacteroidales bacterium]